MSERRKPDPRTDVKRETYSFSADPSVMAEIDALADDGQFRSRSHVIEEAMKLFVAIHKSRQANQKVA